MNNNVNMSNLLNMLNNMDKNQLNNTVNQLNTMLSNEDKSKLMNLLKNNSKWYWKEMLQLANDINITPEMINNLVNMLKNNDTTSSKKEEADTSSIDFETIMKIKTIMETLNKNDDSRSNLLYSLKPYLRKSKQEKLDQYIHIMKISQVTNLFKKGESD